MRKIFVKIFFFTFLIFLVLIRNSTTLEKRIQDQNPQIVKTQEMSKSLKVSSEFSKIPLYFIPNKGQVDERVTFYINGKDKTIYFAPDGLTIILAGPDSGEKVLFKEIHASQRWVIKLDFIEANPDVCPIGVEKNEALVSYFKGNSDEWRTGLPTFSKVIYPNLWPGIDLAYYGTWKKLKYEFIVHPGADVSKIRLAYRGATDVTVNKNGQLEVKTPLGDLQDDAPQAYQEIEGNRVSVPLDYLLHEETSDCIRDVSPKEEPETRSYVYGFEAGDYDQTQSLVIDPAVLVYSGYIGGTNFEFGNRIAVDSSGNTYIVGYTFSDEYTFPVATGPDLTYNGGTYDAFVAKVNAAGTSLLYCGYIGGSNEEFGNDIGIDGSGNVYITGYTSSTETDFPVTIGPDLTYNGGIYDAFVAKINAAGTSLLYCGYIGGSDSDEGSGIAVDNSGFIYITGRTHSLEIDFPVTIGPDLTYNGGTYDAFVAKVNATGTSLVYCGYIGGLDEDFGFSIDLDTLGNIYVTGDTFSTEATFPVTVGPDMTFNGVYDGFVAKINTGGTALVYCGYIGGSDEDYGRDIAVDGSGNAYVTGRTRSPESTFPVAVGPDISFNGNKDAYVAKVNVSGTALVYCGFIGGSQSDSGRAIAVDGSGNAYVTGWTESTEATFPVILGPDGTFNGVYDAFIAGVNASGTELLFCGYIGGSDQDYIRGIAVNSSEEIYITGGTLSTESTFPVIVGPGMTFSGNDDAFVAKIADSGDSHMLWAHPGFGWAHLWTLNPSVGLASTKGFAIGAGWWVVSYHRNADGTSQLLWANPGLGWAHLWTLNSSLGIVSTKEFAMGAGWWATGYHRDSDGAGYLLWTLPGNGFAHLWTLNSSDQIVSTRGFAMSANWWAISYHRNADGTSQLLWTYPANGWAHLWTLNSSLVIASTRGFAMSADWWATSYHRNANGTSQLLWTHPGLGWVHRWTLNSSLVIASTRGYSYSTGWWGFSYRGPTTSSGDILLGPEMRKKD